MRNETSLLRTEDINLAAYALYSGGVLKRLAPGKMHRRSFEIAIEDPEGVRNAFARSEIPGYVAQREGLLDRLREEGERD